MTALRLDEHDLDVALARLVADGTLRADQAGAVHDSLVTLPVVTPAGGRGLAAATLAAAYVGAGLLAAALATLLGQSWEELGVAGRSLAFGGLAAVLVAAGAYLGGRAGAARGLAWLLAVPATGGFGAALLSQDGRAPETLFLAAGLASLAVAGPLLWWRRAAPQVLGLVAALLTVTGATVGHLGWSAGRAGGLVWAVGMGVGAAAVLRRLPVQPFTLALGGAVALYGTLLAGATSLAACAVLAVLLASAGYVLAVRQEPAVPLTVATLTVATAGPRVLGEWLSGSLGAAGVLAVSGLVVLAAAAVHLRLVRRREG